MYSLNLSRVMMNLDDYRFKLRDKNSRFKDRLFKDHATSDLVEAGALFLSSEKPDIEIATLIDHELRKRQSLEKTSENVEACKEIKNAFKKANIKPIEWLFRARVRLRTLHNAPDGFGTFSTYVILLDWLDKNNNYGVYVGQSRKLPDERFLQHIEGVKAGQNVEERGVQLLWSLMPYANNVLKAKTRKMYESAVHHCLASVKAKGFKNDLLKVGGDGKKQDPNSWPGNFQMKLKNFLSDFHEKNEY